MLLQWFIVFLKNSSGGVLFNTVLIHVHILLLYGFVPTKEARRFDATLTSSLSLEQDKVQII